MWAVPVFSFALDGINYPQGKKKILKTDATFSDRKHC